MITEKSGTDFDPDLVKEFVRIQDKVKNCLDVKEQMITDQQYFMVQKEK